MPGGIIFQTLGDRQPSRFNGLRLERNIIWHIDRSGIAAQSYHAARTRWFPSTNIVIRDNWVGDAGGFLLLCTPGKRKTEDNLGNVGTIARYNISRHDRARSFNISAVEHTRIHHNAIYIGPGHEVQVVLFSHWSGWAKDLELVLR